MSAIATTINISLTPERLNLRLYAGDGAIIKLRFAQGGSPLPMTDGSFTAQIRASRLDPTAAANWAVDDTEADQGIITLSLTGAETAALLQNYNKQRYRYGFKGSWDAQWTPTDLEPITLFQGDCYCDADVTR